MKDVIQRSKGPGYYERDGAGFLDVARPPERRGLTSKAIIDACIPYEQIESFPRRARFDPELRKEVIEKYGNALFE